MMNKIHRAASCIRDLFFHPAPHRVFDIHSHIVFGVDDGAYDLQMSIDMLKMACSQGVQDIICTSHSGINQAAYRANLDILQQSARAEGLPVRLYPGCEIACRSQKIPMIADELNCGLLPSINDGSFILVEFTPYAQCDEILHCIQQLHAQTQKQIILAHAERCHMLYANQHILNQPEIQSCRIQINAFSLVDEPNGDIRDFARMLLHSKLVSFIGSDAHRIDHRPPQIKSGVDYIHEHCDPDYATAVCWKNAEQLLLQTAK